MYDFPSYLLGDEIYKYEQLTGILVNVLNACCQLQFIYGRFLTTHKANCDTKLGSICVNLDLASVATRTRFLSGSIYNSVTLH